MKNVVMGLFDRLEDAEAVIAQLTASPLDLESIQVIHADTAIQRRLGLQAGLPARRAVRTGAVLGALLGAAIGFAGGGSLFTEGAPGPLSSLGPLLAMSLGAVLGLVLGALAGAISDRLRIPGGHAAEVAAAIDAGATAVTVRTENLPTAKAIGDLFQRSGSKVLSSEPIRPAGLEDDHVSAAEFAFSPDVEASDDPADVPEAHAAFAPPWRREDTAPAGETWLDADTAPRVDASDSIDQGSEPSLGSGSGSGPSSFAQPSPPSGPFSSGSAANTGLPTLDGDMLFPSAAPATSPAPSESRSRTIRRGETVSTPDRTTQAVQPRTVSRSTEPTAGGSAIDSPATVQAEADNRSSASIESQGLGSLELSPRVQNALQKAGIQDVAALQGLAAQGQAQISALPGVGPAAVKEVKQGLAAHGFDMDETGPASSPTVSTAQESTTSQKTVESKPTTSKKRSATRSKPVPQSNVDKAAESVLREIFGTDADRDA